MPASLRDYQIDDLAQLIAHKKHMNLSDPSTGKTPSACVLAYYVWTKEGKKTVWAMPQSLLWQNHRKLLQFTEFKAHDIEVVTSDHAKLKRSWCGPTFIREKQTRVKTDRVGPDGKAIVETSSVDEKVADILAASKAKVFLCSFAFLRNHWAHFLKAQPNVDLFLTDEHHLGYSGPESGQTKSLYMLNRHVSRFVPMTGSLLDGRLDTAFSALHAIEPNYYGSYAGFLAEHAGFTNDYGKVESWRGEDKLREILKRHSIRHTRKDVYGDCTVVPDTEIADMGPKMRGAYTSFEYAALLELESGFLDGTQPGVATIRARQILAHPETMGLCKGEVPGKDERLLVYAAEREPMIVFASLVPEQERIRDLLIRAGRKVGMINGNVAMVDRVRIDKQFTGGQLDTIVGSPATCAVGFDWEQAARVVFCSLDYRDTNVRQAMLRGDRGTRTTPLLVTFLMYDCKVEHRIRKILRDKSIMTNKVDPTYPVLEFSQ